MSEKAKEQIKFNTEILKFLVVMFLATGGGSLSLILHGFTHAREVILASGGMIFAIFFISLAYWRYKITQQLIDGL